MHIKLNFLVLLMILVFIPLVAVAQEQSTAKKDWAFALSVGTIYAPAFTGSNDYQMSALPFFKVEYQDRFFASIKDGIGYNIINNNGWRFGPVAKYDMGREEDGDNPFRIAGRKTDALMGFGDIDPTLELGGFVEYKWGSFTPKIELRQGVDGHKGMLAEAGINYGGSLTQFGPPIIFALGPRVTFADPDYNNVFFGINQTQSANSGLNQYKASSGVVSYGVGGFALLPITEKVSLYGFGGYERLGTEPGDSPLIEQRGSKNQFVCGLSASYKFSL